MNDPSVENFAPTYYGIGTVRGRSVTAVVMTPPERLSAVPGKEQAAAQAKGDAEEEEASPFGPGGTPFDQFLRRFGQPFQSRNPQKKAWRRICEVLRYV